MKVSAIVPVYNSEKYVGRCIDSVLSQTYSNWELILVDDGSKDNSLAVLREYEKKDSRIRVIHQENAGPGFARNVGVDHATGDYIVFVDSDDKINERYFALLSEKNDDVVFIDVDQVDENFQIIKTEYMSRYQSLPKDDFLRQQMTGKINWGGVRKAVKKELLLKNEIRFSKHKLGEEAIYSFLILWNAKSFSFINGPVYEYVNRVGSQSDLQMDDPWGEVARNLKNKISDMGLYGDYAGTINAFIATATIISFDKMAGKYRFDKYRLLAKKRLRQFRSDFDDNYQVDFKSMDKKALMLYPILHCGCVTAVYVVSSLRRIIRK